MSRHSSKPLEGADVLITRPVGQGRMLARRVRALGGRPVGLPGVSLRAAPDPPRAALLEALADDLVIFTSPAAVRFAARLAPLRGRARVACVGAGTARVLARQGVGEVVVPRTTQNSAGLLAHLALAPVRGRRVAVVGAPGGRGTLQRTLRERGARLREVHVYRRMPARLDRRHHEALRRLRGNAYALLSSAGSLRNLRAALDDPAWQRFVATHAVVSSRHIAAAAHRAGFERVSVAGSALDDAMLERVAELDAKA